MLSLRVRRPTAAVLAICCRFGGRSRTTVPSFARRRLPGAGSAPVAQVARGGGGGDSVVAIYRQGVSRPAVNGRHF